MSSANPMSDAELEALAASLQDLDLITGPVVRRLLATIAAERARAVEAQAAGLGLMLVLEYARTNARGTPMHAIRTQSGSMLIIDETLAKAGAILQRGAA